MVHAWFVGEVRNVYERQFEQDVDTVSAVQDLAEEASKNFLEEQRQREIELEEELKEKEERRKAKEEKEREIQYWLEAKKQEDSKRKAEAEVPVRKIVKVATVRKEMEAKNDPEYTRKYVPERWLNRTMVTARPQEAAAEGYKFVSVKESPPEGLELFFASKGEFAAWRDEKGVAEVKEILVKEGQKAKEKKAHQKKSGLNVTLNRVYGEKNWDRAIEKRWMSYNYKTLNTVIEWIREQLDNGIDKSELQETMWSKLEEVQVAYDEEDRVEEISRVENPKEEVD